ncbi:NAD(P)/FAD-dependent oxidoreductase [Streptomyces sp. 142MFCol3.1]|uniref:NAD(P)/FAD-dependent oxidoreductase n=1 Tax=Streptomyces sp. 142MFCol3.1 TaxID=1172179 RepID=UPI0003F8FC09|nr:NAD(P)/FAD-dependent oxidoreductase [Streptomyces sp. 142MFCol3.1]
MQPLPASDSPDKAVHDVAVLGAGIAGSILAAILSRNGVKTVLIDAGTHPRFAVGESTIPYTSVMLRILAARYGVPEIAHLSHFSTMRSKVSSNSGQKRNFGFVYHREGEKQVADEINQFVIPVALSTESHMFRQDVDSYMFNVAVRYGAVPRLGTRVSEVEVDGSGVTLSVDGGPSIRARYVVDAGGHNSPLARKFGLRDEVPQQRTHSRTLFTHMIGVRPYDDCPAGRAHDNPSPWHQGTLHHVFDGGWVWVIPFDNHRGATNRLCSVGLTLDPRKHPKTDLPAEQEFAQFLERFPDIAPQFRHAKAARPWVSTGRLQYSSHQVVGDRFCLTSHAAGFVDALYSRGLTNTTDVVNSLAWRLIEAAKDDDFSAERFGHIETLQQGLVRAHDEVVASSFTSFRDYGMWNATFRMWALGTVLGTLNAQDALVRFQRSKDPMIWRELEAQPHPGALFPASVGFNKITDAAWAACRDVEAGLMTPDRATGELFDLLQDDGYAPPPFGLHDPANRFYNPNPARMIRTMHWARRGSAAADTGPVVAGALGGFLRSRLRRHS